MVAEGQIAKHWCDFNNFKYGWVNKIDKCIDWHFRQLSSSLGELMGYTQWRPITSLPNKWPSLEFSAFDLPSEYGFTGSYLILSTNGSLMPGAHLLTE